MGSFLFKWPHPDAKDVHVTGTFDDWGKTEQLNKIGDTWEKEVNLPSADEKIYYKFVVDDNWIIDPTAPQEDDGHFNINNVLLPKDIKKHAAGSTDAPVASAAEVQHKTPGGFPETPADEKEQSFGVAPIPASTGIGNPVQLAPGEKVPDPSTVTDRTVDSTATTSKEGYERDASAALPAVAGLAGAGGVGALLGSAFSKPETKENLIPESSLPMGGETKDTLDSGPHIQSAAPESSTAALAAGVPLEKKRQAMVIDPEDAPQTDVETAPGVPETVKESLSEAHQSPEAAASPQAVKEKSAVEQELLKKTTTSEATGDSGVTPATQTSYYGLATEVPPTVEKSMQEAHASPEAAAESSAVAEKSAMESELLKKIPSSEEAGEPAPTIAAATSEAAPTATQDTSSGLTTGEKIAGGAVGGMGAAGVVTALVSDKEKEKEAPSAEPNSETAPVGSSETPAPATEELSKHEKVESTGQSAFTTDPVGIVSKDDSVAKPETVESFKDNPTQAGESTLGTSTGAPASVDHTLADEPAVKMMQQDETKGEVGTGEMFKPHEGVASAYDATTSDVKTKAPIQSTEESRTSTLGPGKSGTMRTTPSSSSTPTKKTAVADNPTSSPANSANTKEKKKRNRLSRLFHKIID